MARERLKDQIEWNPPPSRYATFFNALLILLAVVAVYFSIGDWRGSEAPRHPSSGSTPPPPPAAASQLTLTASHNRTFYWNQTGPYAIDTLAPRLSAWVQTVTKPHIVITTDETGRFGDAATLLEEVRRHGVASISLQAPKAPSPSGHLH